MSSKDLIYTPFPAVLGWSIVKENTDVGYVQVVDLSFKHAGGSRPLCRAPGF